MQRDIIMIDEILKNIEGEKRDIINAWKTTASKNIKDFVRKTSPFRLKISNYYFYIDTKSFTYSIVLRGVKPNAGRYKYFGAPVNKTIVSKKENVYIKGVGWRRVNARQTSNNTNVELLKVPYYGVSAMPDKFFGLKKNNKIVAYGISENIAVPIYTNQGLVEWISENNVSELAEILQTAGYQAINSEV